MIFIIIARGVAGMGSGGILTVTVSTDSHPGAHSLGNHHYRSRIDCRQRSISGGCECAIRRRSSDRSRSRWCSCRRRRLESCILASGPSHRRSDLAHHCQSGRPAHQGRSECVGKVQTDRLVRMWSIGHFSKSIIRTVLTP